MVVAIEKMTPAELNGSISISYSFHESHFGKMIIASTSKGICYMAFADDPDIAPAGLKKKYPRTGLVKQKDFLQLNALKIAALENQADPLILHLSGTEFQLKVWNVLLKIPPGQLTTYARIAADTGDPSASRAVGNAVGSNPVACIIPCHRVIRSDGSIGGYMWGKDRKIRMINREMKHRPPLPLLRKEGSLELLLNRKEGSLELLLNRKEGSL